MAGHPLRGRPPTNPAACSPHRACRPRGQCWAPTPTHPCPQHVGGGSQQPAQWAGSRGRDSALPQTPLTMVESTPPGDALPPPPQQATPARKGARCGAGAGSPRPHRPHPRHTGRGTLAARSRGRAAGGGTAPDTRRPSKRWQAIPPGGGPPPPPRHAAPTGHAGQRDSLGPPHPDTRAHSTSVADPNSPPSWRAVGGGTAPDLRRPSKWWKAPPQGTAFRHPHSEQRQPARAHAVGPVLGPHAHTDRTRNTRDAEPWLPAPEEGRPGERQRLTPGAPHNGGRPPPLGAAPHHPRGMQPPKGMQAKGTVLDSHTHTPAPTARGWRTPTARPVGRQSGEGRLLASGAPHNGGRHLPGDALPPPPQRATPARKGTRRGAGAGSPRPHQPHPGHTGRGTLAARSRGRAAGGGTAPDTRRPSQRWQATPSGDGPPPTPRHAAPTGHAGQGDSVGPPHPHTRAHSTWVADPNSPPSGRAVGGGTAPDPRRPSQWWKAPPPGTPFRHPHSEQRQPARAHAVGPVLGPHACTDRTRDTRDAEPWLPAPEDGRPGEGQRLTPGAPHNGGRPPPPGAAPHHPRGMQPPQGMQAKGTVLGPHTHTPAATARRWRTPTARPVGGQSGEGQRLTSDAPRNGGGHPPRGQPSATPTASNASPQGRTLWGRCWVPTPTRTAPATHGTRNPCCPLQRRGGRGRDSA